jgi:transposase InsO family protein
MKKADPMLNIQHVCQLFDVPISSYYKRQEVATKNVEKEFFISRIIAIHNDNLQCYGRRRMLKSLQKEGINIGIFKVVRLMREAGVIAKIPKKPHYYPSGNEMPNIPNLLKRKFNPETINTHWVGDITYIRNHQGWSYLATVLDLGTREIIGYATSKTPDAQLAKQALINAIAFAQPDTRKLMFHSDQGVQYSANLFKNCLLLHGITQSMSRRGNCWDNAVQERFFRSLKSEYLNGLSFMNHGSVVDAVTYYIRYYNNKRLNSSIDYIAPAQKRRILCNVA